MAAPAIRCVVQSGDMLGETPIWCPRTAALWWIDIERPRLHQYDPATGQHRERPVAARTLGSLALRRSGGFVLGLDCALHAFDPAVPGIRRMGAIEPEARGNRLNDSRCDAAGRLWIGTMDLALKSPQGAFYCIHPDGRLKRVAEGLFVPNAIAIAPDQRTLYLADTGRFVIWAFDLDPADGTLSGRRVFVDHTGSGARPDGACIDAEGFLWNAHFGGGRIVRHAPDGRVDRVAPLPVSLPTCMAFGGPGYETLFVTTAQKFLTPARLAAEPWAGGLLAFEPGVRGLPEAMFGG